MKINEHLIVHGREQYTINDKISDIIDFYKTISCCRYYAYDCRDYIRDFFDNYKISDMDYIDAISDWKDDNLFDKISRGSIYDSISSLFGDAYHR